MISKETLKKILKKNKQKILILDLELYASGSECNVITKDGDINYILVNGKKYPFKRLSDTSIIPNDSEILLNEDLRKSNCLYGDIKILALKALPKAKLYIASTVAQELTTLIVFEKKGKRYIIDYEYNLVMQEKYYNDIFEPELIEEKTEEDIYKMFMVYEAIGNTLSSYSVLRTYEELHEDLNKHVLIKNKGNN